MNTEASFANNSLKIKLKIKKPIIIKVRTSPTEIDREGNYHRPIMVWI